MLNYTAGGKEEWIAKHLNRLNFQTSTFVSLFTIHILLSFLGGARGG